MGWVLCGCVPLLFGMVYAATGDGALAGTVLVIGLVATAVVVTEPERRRVAGLREESVVQGWQHTPTADDPVVSTLAPLDHPGEVRDLIRGTWRGRAFLAYDRSHTLRRDPDDPETETRHQLAVVAVSARPTAPIALDPPARRWLPPWQGTAPASVFDVRWTVAHGELDALPDAARERLLTSDTRGLHVRCTDAHVVAIRRRPFTADELAPVLDLLCDLAPLVETRGGDAGPPDGPHDVPHEGPGGDEAEGGVGGSR